MLALIYCVTTKGLYCIGFICFHVPTYWFIYIFCFSIISSIGIQTLNVKVENQNSRSTTIIEDLVLIEIDLPSY